MREFSDQALDMVAGRFKILAEPMRLRILNTLRRGEKTVSEIVEEVDAGQANVSKHLGLLHRNRLVRRRKEGLHVYYAIADGSIFDLCGLICDSMESEIEDQMRALAAVQSR